MLARVIKHSLSQLLRNAKRKYHHPSEEPYRELSVKYLNLCLGNSKNSEKYRNSTLFSKLVQKVCKLTLDMSNSLL